MTVKQRVEEVFVTEGVPHFTFVKPPNYNENLSQNRFSRMTMEASCTKPRKLAA